MKRILVVYFSHSGHTAFVAQQVARRCRADLLASLDRAITRAAEGTAQDARFDENAGRLASLTERQRAVLDMVLAGQPSKNIATDLGISQRTVESHRAHIMQRLGVRTIPELVRAVLSARPG